MTIRILGLLGSARPGSAAERALTLALGTLERAGVQCESFDVLTLPLVDGRPDADYPAAVAAFRAAADAADGFVIAVGPFHGGMPGSLKNALDFLDVEQVGGKPFAVIGVAYGDAEPGVTDVTRVMRHLGAVGGVHDVVVSRARDHWGSGPEPANRAVTIAISKVADDLEMLCQLRADGKLPSP